MTGTLTMIINHGLKTSEGIQNIMAILYKLLLTMGLRLLMATHGNISGGMVIGLITTI